MRATDQEIIASYQTFGSIWRTGQAVGISGQSVHERLQKLGIDTSMNLWTQEDDARLCAEYLLFRDAGKLSDLASSMCRTKQFICRKARTLGLTDPSHVRRYSSVWKHISAAAAEAVWSKFKTSRLGLGKFCTRYQYDDLGFSKAMRAAFPDEYEAVIELKQPKTTKYRLGRGFEYRVRDRLKELGFLALRSPASKGPFDLIAIRHGESLLVQCKVSGVLPVAGWNELYYLAESVGAVPLCAAARPTRGFDWWKLIGPKDGSKRPQPWVQTEII